MFTYTQSNQCSLTFSPSANMPFAGNANESTEAGMADIFQVPLRNHILCPSLRCFLVKFIHRSDETNCKSHFAVFADELEYCKGARAASSSVSNATKV